MIDASGDTVHPGGELVTNLRLEVGVPPGNPQGDIAVTAEDRGLFRLLNFYQSEPKGDPTALVEVSDGIEHGLLKTNVHCWNRDSEIIQFRDVVIIGFREVFHFVSSVFRHGRLNAGGCY